MILPFLGNGRVHEKSFPFMKAMLPHFSYTVKICRVCLLQNIEKFVVIKLSVLKKCASFAQTISE
jgi:hypothetical protein